MLLFVDFLLVYNKGRAVYQIMGQTFNTQHQNESIHE